MSSVVEESAVAQDASSPVDSEQAALRKAVDEICLKQWELESQKRYQLDERVGIPWSPDVMSTLTDLYQITMSYAYWKANKHNQVGAFEVFFRRNPFKGEYTILAGVNDVIRYINTFKFDGPQIRFLKTLMPDAEPDFFAWLGSVDASNVTVYSVKEGNIVFPRAPLMRIEGPLAVCQLMETTILNLLNFASLIATNSARYRVAAGFDKTLLEFGLRRAQGPDGGMSASRFSFLGGFDATSNVRASFLFGIPCKGTHAHAYISSFKDLNDLPSGALAFGPAFDSKAKPDLKAADFSQRVVELRTLFCELWEGHSAISANEGELAAFIAYAQAFPSTYLALVDTYDVMMSGVPNFCFVAIALKEWGYEPLGIRLDSGDLSYLSLKSRDLINAMGAYAGQDLSKTSIVASNSINEEILNAFKLQTHAIDTFGIGTHLVTCYNQPALGMVFKLCEVNGEPTMKISQEISKTTLPYKKEVYRLFDRNNIPLLDLIDTVTAPPPVAGARVYCQHIVDETKRCYVIPSRVEKLLKLHWKQGRATKYGAPETFLNDNGGDDEDLSTESDLKEHAEPTDTKYDGKRHFEYLKKCRDLCLSCLRTFREDHLRAVNPTPYKISISRGYSEVYRSLWDSTAPVRIFE
eukprot:Gregarina_sp_Pseudo_9__1895@NODE_22_length_5725_cov_32_771720_g20_i0_p1_GENE_NODE_22_length_5725_cov_32_771720_g20_i0NODE_22_length_5725_cov_32_771720_g20_i0_p1_ORF_typecomplete_len636_score133_67NAPRTase/PF04095_16/4_3e49NAPRTase_N/PF17767_1/4_5e39NAPRTase_N/PF17767_1/8_4e03NAPRTase_C/PF17956_1/3_1e22QRPTase_N/PF02749_16/0_00073QRPTase_C/PF01729_19/2_8e03QRPTase_C/PF01729_19/0_031_NODE_22_length_5725_cov_32_771720_g20_i036265533